MHGVGVGDPRAAWMGGGGTTVDPLEVQEERDIKRAVSCRPQPHLPELMSLQAWADPTLPLCNVSSHSAWSSLARGILQVTWSRTLHQMYSTHGKTETHLPLHARLQLGHVLTLGSCLRRLLPA